MTDLWAPKDIQREIGRSRTVVAAYQREKDFPKPVLTVGPTRLYDAKEVREWWAERSGANTRRNVIRFAKRHGIPAAARKFDVPYQTAYRWVKD